MFYTVYQITHRESGKVYIGKHQTLNLEDGYFGSGQRICRAVKKHGRSAFDKKILYVFETEEEMNAKEAELVTEEFCLREDTYNLCPGGQGGWGYVNTSGLRESENRLQAIRIHNTSPRGREIASLAGKASAEKNKVLFSENAIRNERFSFAGRTHSEEVRLVMKIKAKDRGLGTTNSQFSTMWITNGQSNKKINKEHPIPDGWYRGRKFPNGWSLKDRIK